MAETTEIPWCDATFNGWIGCAKVSDGCKHCYASVDTFARTSRAKGLELWGVNAARHRTSTDNWKKPWKWNHEAGKAGVRRRVFCASLSDVFEDRRDLDAPRIDLFDMIERTTNLDWLLLTKRPENMTRLAPASWGSGWPRNVWAGCTVEDQENADRRIPHLLRVPAAVRFLSVEPMLGPVSLRWAKWHDYHRPGWRERGEVQNHLDGARGIGWLIVGGESGACARPFDLAWAASLSKECRAASVPYFFKQAGALPMISTMGTAIEPANAGEWIAAESAIRVRLSDRKGGDTGELAHALSDLDSAGVFRREWPEVCP